VKRDLRRTVGEYREVDQWEINGLRLGIEAVIREGKAAMVEGWMCRRAAQARSVRVAAEAVCHGRPWMLHFSKRGDLCFFLQRAQ